MIWVILLALFVVAVVIAVLVMQGGRKGVGELPYVKARSLFTPAERSFLGVLDQAIVGNHRILGKVRVADVVNVKSMVDLGEWQRAFNRISAKHFDFVMCRADDLSVVCVIELGDQSHQRPKRQDRDGFLADVCKAASLPLVRIPAQRSYSVPEIRASLDAVLGSPDSAT